MFDERVINALLLTGLGAAGTALGGLIVVAQPKMQFKRLGYLQASRVNLVCEQAECAYRKSVRTPHDNLTGHTAEGLRCQRRAVFIAKASDTASHNGRRQGLAHAEHLMRRVPAGTVTPRRPCIRHVYLGLSKMPARRFYPRFASCNPWTR